MAYPRALHRSNRARPLRRFVVRLPLAADGPPREAVAVSNEFLARHLSQAGAGLLLPASRLDRRFARAGDAAWNDHGHLESAGRPCIPFRTLGPRTKLPPGGTLPAAA